MQGEERSVYSYWSIEEFHRFLQEWGSFRADMAALKRVLVDDGYEKRLRDLEQELASGRGVKRVLSTVVATVIATATAVAAALLGKG